MKMRQWFCFRGNAFFQTKDGTGERISRLIDLSPKPAIIWEKKREVGENAVVRLCGAEEQNLGQ